MRYGSVCSGIEAASVAWEPLGWEPAWFSEIESFPCKVLAERFPRVPNLGDMTLLEGRILSGEVEAPDVLVGGTPCQAFSVAGLRGSLSDARGQLSLVFVRLANAIDIVREKAGKPPCIVLWENVPGALSTKDNSFGHLLGGLVGADGPVDPGKRWTHAGVVAGPQRTAAWRTLDARFFGVAQRRRRVFVLARGGAGAWACADALLPLGPRGAGDSEPRRTAREEAAGGAADGAGVCCLKGAAIGRKPENGPQFSDARSDGLTYTLNCTEVHAVAVPELAGTLGAKKDGGWRGDLDSSGAYIPEPLAVHENQRAELTLSQTAGTLKCSDGKPGQGYPAVLEPVVAFSSKDFGADATEELSPTLRAGHHDGSHANGGCPPAVAFSIVPESGQGADLRAVEVDTAPALTATAEAEATDRGVRVVQPMACDLYNGAIDGDVAATLSASTGASANHSGPSVLQSRWCVRRLTPTECERLQGFPDGWTAIDGAADGPRYRALGNSMAVPVMRWIGKRISIVASHIEDLL